MKRIYRAINEGLTKSLINFDDNGLKKSKATLHNIKEFHFGDYVYKDSVLGYNNYVGEKVAICVNDEPNKELYVVLNHPLLTKNLKWASRNTNLYKAVLPDFKDSFKNTLYILENYKDELSETIWQYLEDREYIPSADELETIYNNCKDTPLWDEIGFRQITYWTSSWYSSAPDRAFYVFFYNGCSDIVNKAGNYRSVVLLHIN